MKQTAPMAMLLALCSTGCADPAPLILTPDAAQLEGCPTRFPVAPALPERRVETLPDGRLAVLLDVQRERDRITAAYLLLGRDAYLRCRSAVTYVQDWMRETDDGAR